MLPELQTVFMKITSKCSLRRSRCPWTFLGGLFISKQYLCHSGHFPSFPFVAQFLESPSEL